MQIIKYNTPEMNDMKQSAFTLIAQELADGHEKFAIGYLAHLKQFSAYDIPNDISNIQVLSGETVKVHNMTTDRFLCVGDKTVIVRYDISYMPMNKNHNWATTDDIELKSFGDPMMGMLSIFLTSTHFPTSPDTLYVVANIRKVDKTNAEEMAKAREFLKKKLETELREITITKSKK
jgi:hypothetical protein